MGTPASLPTINSDDRVLNMLQDSWSGLLDPVLKNPLVQGRLMTNVTLASGSNTINHLLARKLQGWIIVGRNTADTVYDAQASNSMQDKTLILVASGAITVNLWVF